MKHLYSVHGSYYEINYGDILLVNLFSNWIKAIDRDAVINLPMVDKKYVPEMPEGRTGLINLIRSEKLVFCGGGYFGEKPRKKKRWAIRNFYRHGIVGLFAILFRIPYVIVGVEFGPISTPWFRKVVILIAKHAKSVIVRNEDSKLFLEHYGVANVQLSADAVLSLSDTVRPIDTSENSTKKILLHLTEVKRYESEYVVFIDKLCEVITKTNMVYEISFIFDSPANMLEYKDIMNQLNNNGVKYSVCKFETCEKLINLINSASYVFTSKLHVGITAAALNKPVFSLYAHPKTQRLHKQIDNSEYCIPISTLLSIDNSLLNLFFKRTKYKLPVECLNNARYNKKVVEEFIA